MALTVRTNIAAIQSAGALTKTTKKLQKSLMRVSSGLRINTAADDAAGMGVANALETTSISLRQAMRNTNDGVSIIQIAETATDEITNILQRMRELAVQSASETLSDQERSYIGDEYDELLSEIDRIATATSFNGVNLTDATTDLAVQVGTTSSTMVSQISIHLGDLTASTGLGLNASTVSLTSSSLARTSLDVLDTALTSVSSLRSSFGAVQNRFDSTLNNAATYYEALAAAESRIRDLDFADETAELTKLQILQQSGVAALAQAKNINQSVVSLLQ